MARFLCFRFSLDPLRFSLMREIDTEITIAISWPIWKNQILKWQNWSKHQFCKIAKYQMAIFCIRLQVIYSCLAFDTRIFLSWEKFEWIDRTFKTQNLSLWLTIKKILKIQKLLFIFRSKRPHVNLTLHISVQCVAYVYTAVVLGWKPGKSSRFQSMLDIQETLTDFHGGMK
jgi:hypothetical protein